MQRTLHTTDILPAWYQSQHKVDPYNLPSWEYKDYKLTSSVRQFKNTWQNGKPWEAVLHKSHRTQWKYSSTRCPTNNLKVIKN